LLDLGSRKY